MDLHHSYLVALSLVFALALTVTIVSLIAHRRALGTPRAAFFAPTGGVQFVWALLPMAILFAVDYALLETPGQQRAAPQKVAIALADRPSEPRAASAPGAADASGRRR